MQFVTMNTPISFEPLGNIWRNLARPHEPTNDDIRVWVEQYIEHRGVVVGTSDENRRRTDQGKTGTPNIEMGHGEESQAVIFLGT